MEIKCKQCDGFYKLRDGRFGVFAGCSNYPRCKSTLKLYEFVQALIQAWTVSTFIVGSGFVGSAERLRRCILIFWIMNWRLWMNF